MTWKGILDVNDLFFSTYSREPVINECLVFGEIRINYDGCSSGTLEDGKKFYDKCGNGWVYIGSGHKTWHNGRENNWKELHHFFIKPERMNEGFNKLLRKLKIETINKNKHD